MKKILYIALPVAMMLTMTSCDWFNSTFLGKPSKAELAKKEAVEKARQDSLDQAEMVRQMEAQQHELEQRMADETAQKEQAAQGQRYHVVVGCFKVPSNADRMLNLLNSKGYTAHLMKFKNGFSCISAASYADVHTAYNEMYKILKADWCPEDVWVYDSNTKLHTN